jgi:glucose-6-phosphate isomerase
MSILRCDRTTAWSALHSHYQAHGCDFDLRQAFAADKRRFEALSLQAPEVFADLSKNRLGAATLALLCKLARECGIEARRDAMLRGEPVNLTEGRAVLHTALRAPAVPGVTLHRCPPLSTQRAACFARVRRGKG